MGYDCSRPHPPRWNPADSVDVFTFIMLGAFCTSSLANHVPILYLQFASIVGIFISLYLISRRNKKRQKAEETWQNWKCRHAEKTYNNWKLNN